jgi:hypothetical protein
MADDMAVDQTKKTQDSAPAIPPTRSEIATNMLLSRFSEHVRKWYPKFEVPEHPDYHFEAKDGPFELWSGKFFWKDTSADPGFETIWLLWNGAQTRSYPSACAAFYRLVEDQKARRTESKVKHFTSPLTVSAILAVLLLVLISLLEFCGKEVPNQLWSVFTAVVAFYFGRESGKEVTSPIH